MEMKEAVAALAALAQESRLGVFRLLVEQGPKGLPAGRIAQRLGLPPATLSFHLGQLTHAGLARARREGRSIVYAADYGGMQHLMSYLTENCCGGQEADCSPSRAAARGKGRSRGAKDRSGRGGRGRGAGPAGARAV